MTDTINITSQMLEKLGVEVEDILGPGIELASLTLSLDGKISLSLRGKGDNAPHPEVGELKAAQLMARFGERLGDDWNPVKFSFTAAWLNGNDLQLPEVPN